MSEAFLDELAAIFAVARPTLTDDFPIETWDSLALVSTIALIDEHFEVVVRGKQLTACKTVGQVFALIAAKKG